MFLGCSNTGRCGCLTVRVQYLRRKELEEMPLFLFAINTEKQPLHPCRWLALITCLDKLRHLGTNALWTFTPLFPLLPICAPVRKGAFQNSFGNTLIAAQDLKQPKREIAVLWTGLE